MSTATQKLLAICEQLPETLRVELTEYAQSLLAKSQNVESRQQAMRDWLKAAAGVAKPGVTTAQIMEMTRGES